MANLRTDFEDGELFLAEYINETNRAVNEGISTASQAAEDASGYLADLQEAIQNLPDGQAVSAEVADHEVRVSDIEDILYGNGQTPEEIVLSPNDNVVRAITYGIQEIKWAWASTHKHQCIPCVSGDKFKITANNSYSTRYAFLKSYDASVIGDNSQTPPAVDFATGYSESIVIEKNAVAEITAPSDAHWLYILTEADSSNRIPSEIIKGEEIEGDGLIAQVEAQQEGVEYLSEAVSDLNATVNGGSSTQTISLPSANDKKRHIDDNNTWIGLNSGYKHQCIPCISGDVFNITAGSVYGTEYCFLDSYDPATIEDSPAPSVDMATGYNAVVAVAANATSGNITAPLDAHWLYIETCNSNNDCRPTSLLKIVDEEGLVDQLVNKVDKMQGKGLSTNDFTDDYKNKLEGIDSSIETVQEDIDEINGTIKGSQPISIVLDPDNNVIRSIFSGKFSQATHMRHQCIPCISGDKFVIRANSTYGYSYCFLKSYDKTAVSDTTQTPDADFATGYSDKVSAVANSEIELTAPSDAHWLFIETQSYNYGTSSETNEIPASILKGDYIPSLKEEILAEVGSIFSKEALEPYMSNGYITYCSFDLTLLNNGVTIPILLNIRARYTGATPPTIQFLVGSYQSFKFVIGTANEYFESQTLRVPPAMGSMPSVKLRFDIPQNTYLYIEDFTSTYEYGKPRPLSSGLRINSHLGFLAYAPEQTMASIEAAAMMGYDRCIINPIRTSDGVWMCYHGGKAYLSQDGTKANAIAIADNDFANYTYAQIRSYEVITSDAMHAYWQNCKVPMLEEVFELMSKTGMMPVFSVHPSPDATKWGEIKTLLIKYNLLAGLTIKIFSTGDANLAYSVFGDAIESYIFITSASTKADLTAACTNLAATSLANAKCRIGVESTSQAAYTVECIEEILANGFYPTIESYVGYYANSNVLKALIRAGATDLTDDILACCNGVNW